MTDPLDVYRDRREQGRERLRAAGFPTSADDEAAPPEPGSNADPEPDPIELDALRREIAREKGVPPTLAGRLNGESRAELEADAEKLLELVERVDPGPRTGLSAGARGGSGSLVNPPPGGAGEQTMDDAIRAWAAGRRAEGRDPHLPGT